MKDHATHRFAAFLISAVAMLSYLPSASAAEGPGPLKNAEIRDKGINVIPRPAQMEAGEGRFTLTAQTAIRVSPDTERIGRYLAEALTPATGFQIKVAMEASGNGRAGAITLSLSGDAGRLGDEGYELRVLADRVLIKAAKPAGVFYGCQTLRQLFPVQIESRAKVQGVEWSARIVRIEDRPQFVWRGLMLDPARQFITKKGILKCLDWMAYHKMNRLHLHLTDTEGWRVEIKKYPRLTGVGAWADLGEGIKLGGFYTQEDIREIVAYATERFITIVPEIETPSHAGAAMVAYPELNCFGTRKTTYGWDPLCGSEYCPGNDKVFEFLDGVFTEVAQLFPGPYIHVGGDEAEMRYWAECPKCQKRIKDEKVGNLHAWFMERVKNIAESKGKRIIGWGGVAKGAVFTCWDADGSGGWSAAKSGWDVIMSTGNNLYINYNIDRTTLKATYDFDPAPASAGLTPDARRHILGVEACLWGEMVPENHIDSQAFPRVLALAERGWGIDQYDFEDFVERVKVHVVRLAGMGVLTGPAFGYPIVPSIPARVRDGLPSLIYTQNRNDEDWRWTLTGIDRGQGYDSLHPLHAFDGDLETYYLTWGPRKDFDTFTILIEKPDAFGSVRAVTGMANADHILRQGVLEVSSGYGRWKEVARFKKGVAEAKLDGTPVAAVRIRSTINQPPFALLAVREIILEKNGKSTLKEISPVERLRLPVVTPK